MRRIRPPLFLLALSFVLSVSVTGCATGGSGGANVYRKDLGKVMVAPLTTAREKIFGKYLIPVYREESTARSTNWESQWMPRNPTPEESAVGVIGGRNRVTLRGTYAEERLDGTVVLRVRFEVENQVQTEMNPEWHPGPVSPLVEEKFEAVYNDMMLELRTGIIR